MTTLKFDEGEKIEISEITYYGMKMVKKQKVYSIDKVYPGFIICHDENGRKNTFGVGELIQNGYAYRMKELQYAGDGKAV